MSTANCLQTEDQLLCCICLDVFTDPVTLPCGHNFCKNCITQHLNFNSHRQCPMCKEQVNKKCKLKVNTFISELADQFRQSAGSKASDSSEQRVDTPAEVSSDVPTRTKRTGLKSCLWLLLACLIIYFAINLNLHQTISSLTTHQLFDTEENVAVSMCPEHGKPLDLYCKNENMAICQTCAESSHRFHHIVPLKEEYEEKKTELWKTEAAILQSIVERQLKIQEIKHWAKLSKEAADRETDDGVHVFSGLIQSLEKARAELIERIKAKQKTTETQAIDFIQKMKQEISELIRRRAEVEQLSHSEDHLHLLQSFTSVNVAPPANHLPDISICPVSHEEILRTALVTALDQLTEKVRDKMEKLREAELMSVQQSAVDVTLDPDTAHPALALSDDGKQVHHSGVRNKLPDSSKRFERQHFVLGKQGFSCGRFYYDVQVKGKMMWILGVAKESVERKKNTELNPENGYWTIFQSRKHLFALASRAVSFSVNDPPDRVRVFVDYDEGLVSFYNADSAALLYSFTGCSFTEKLYPFFSPGSIDSAALIISPVNQHR
ncbi:E3 ubiquitin-protein ligase TRIM41-like [Plectropomus leopardus]|uniref:E3 ubiquitin-protein ligase TRIM41-like n=1 Tax=Plectropomus leopardus TaxID=160734 RepID=UPI001C4CC5F1|nr:E3 ubiquitin-protein ligase TRIM41-like [Plectropomus leopardus]